MKQREAKQKTILLTSRGESVEPKRACATPHERYLMVQLQQKGTLDYYDLSLGEKMAITQLVDMDLVYIKED